MESNKVVEIIIQLLKEKGKTIFVSSHIIDPLLKVCDAICLLKDGSFAKQYTRADYHSLEQDLFGKFGEGARLLLEGSM